jgi:hypothetical protein
MLLPLIASGCAAVDEDELISAPPQAESASDTQSARGRRPNLIKGVVDWDIIAPNNYY